MGHQEDRVCSECGETIPDGVGHYNHPSGLICLECHEKNKDISDY